MKALTLTQPWASLVIAGEKRIETRSWGSMHTGPLAIHAAKTMSADDMALCHTQPFRAALRRMKVGRISELPRGMVLGTVHVREVVRMTEELISAFGIRADWDKEEAFGGYSPGRWAWILEKPKAFPTPIPARGMLQLWDWEPPS